MKTGLLGGGRTPELRAQAEAMIAEGRGSELMLLPGRWYVASAESYYDRLTTMPSTVDTAPEISCPTLYIRGDEESRES